MLFFAQGTVGDPVNISLPYTGLLLNTLASLEQLWVCDVILVYLLVYEYHYIFIARLNYCTDLAAAQILQLHEE